MPFAGFGKSRGPDPAGRTLTKEKAGEPAHPIALASIVGGGPRTNNGAEDAAYITTPAQAGSLRYQG